MLLVKLRALPQLQKASPREPTPQPGDRESRFPSHNPFSSFLLHVLG